MEIYGESSVSMDFAPEPGDEIVVEADGPVEIGLPWGMGYDLTVWGDPEHTLTVDDLGFARAAGGSGYFAGWSGSEVQIEVVVSGGDVTIHAL